MSPTSLSTVPGSLALSLLLSPLSTMPPPPPSPIVNLLWPPFLPKSSPWSMTLVSLLPSGLRRLSPSPPPRQSAQPPLHHQPHPTWRRPSGTCPLVLLLSPHTAPPKWHPRCLKCHPLPPLLSKLNLLSRKRNSPPALHLVQSPYQIFPSFLRENGMATQTHRPNATWTHPRRLSYSPLATPNQRKPNFTLSVIQPPNSATPVPPRFHCF